ncbi:protein of unknown function [Pseudomonas sp. JV551A1]|uniref:Uncharacterized protein n=1 Tax=Pseudomonas inefficax TaxID=2078786 RepID=A0AAQ1PDB7_9PSED|nr:protein of unknown function [Pseudomonas sp. JV551A1]SPO62273.1 protein of unknown function [Pseudomonas inefficax]
MQKNDPYVPVIVWRRRFVTPPDREPDVVDVQQGRAEYLLSGPYRLTEGARVEVIDGALLWTGSSA